jgi:hypothetical protein
MLTIRLPKKQWGKAWRAMIEVGPIRLVARDLIYEVLPVHLDILNSRGFPYEVIPSNPRSRGRQRHGKAD